MVNKYIYGERKEFLGYVRNIKKVINRIGKFSVKTQVWTVKIRPNNGQFTESERKALAVYGIIAGGNVAIILPNQFDYIYEKVKGDL